MTRFYLHLEDLQICIHIHRYVYTYIYVYVVCKHLNAKVILCFYPNFAFFYEHATMHMTFRRLHKQTICSGQYTFYGDACVFFKTIFLQFCTDFPLFLIHRYSPSKWMVATLAKAQMEHERTMARSRENGRELSHMENVPVHWFLPPTK